MASTSNGLTLNMPSNGNPTRKPCHLTVSLNSCLNGCDDFNTGLGFMVNREVSVRSDNSTLWLGGQRG